MLGSTATSVLLTLVLQAEAAPEASGSASGSVSASTRGDASARGESSGRSDKPMRRWAPERNMFELGLWLGVLLPNGEHEFYDPRVVAHSAYRTAAFDIGARFGYYPLRWLGGEFEGGVMPTSTEGGGRSTLYAIRGHVVGQLPWWRLAPFLVVGGGGMGVGSAESAAGKDIDASFHWGPGLKFFVNRWVALRLDLRHLVGARLGSKNGAASHGEILLGVSVTFGRKGKEKRASDGDPDGDGFYGDDDACPDDPGTYPDGCPAPDADADGVADADDECPEEPGPAPTGCPDAVDSDGDGVADEIDQCVDVPGAKPTGCPPDSDGDGVADPDDKCVDLPGDPPDGCPPDTDDDGIYDPVDQCVKKPETDNGYEDEDGCPDEVPKKLRGAVGVLPGITFELNSAKIKSSSKPTLDEAARTLEGNPDYILEIEGHTDSTGSREANVQLSQRRADSVKAYLVSKGVESDRIRTRGAGPDEPVADNETDEGRAENRRIEFKVRRKRKRSQDRRRRPRR